MSPPFRTIGSGVHLVGLKKFRTIREAQLNSGSTRASKIAGEGNPPKNVSYDWKHGS